MRSLISTRLSVIFCKLCAPSPAAAGDTHWGMRAAWQTCTHSGDVLCIAQCVCARSHASPHCSLMPFTCFNQHQSVLGMQLFILIGNEKCSCRGREGDSEISGCSDPFSHSVIGSNVTADRGNFADLCTTRTRARTNHRPGASLSL